MNLESQDIGNGRLVRVMEDRIDAAVAISFKDRMKDAIGSGTHRVVLDLSQVSFLDSSGLGAVVAIMKHMGQGRRLELAGMQPAVDKVFRLTRMEKVFTLHQTVGDAFQEAPNAT